MQEGVGLRNEAGVINRSFLCYDVTLRAQHGQGGGKKWSWMRSRAEKVKVSDNSGAGEVRKYGF